MHENERLKQGSATDDPAALPSGDSAPRRILHSQETVRRVIDSLCPGGTANAEIAGSLFAENADLARRPHGEPAPRPSQSVASPPRQHRPRIRDCPGCQAREARATQHSVPGSTNAAAAIDKTLIDREPPTAWHRIRSYVRAILGGPASHAVVVQRRRACVKCPSVEQAGAGLFCNACGCGYRRAANLEVKTRLRRAECPLGRWPSSIG